MTIKLNQFYRSTEKSHGSILFWPDLATPHHVTKVTSLMTGMKIIFIAKDSNPPNLPEVRPIERFWSYLKKLIFDGFFPRNKKELLARVYYIFKLLRSNNSNIRVGIGKFLKNIFQNNPRRIRMVGKYGRDWVYFKNTKSYLAYKNRNNNITA